MKDLVILAILFLILLTAPGSFAGAVDDITLVQAIDLALKQNPDILAAQKEMLASQGRRLQMQAIPEPQIILSNEGIPFSTGHNEKNEKEISFGIEQPFEFPGKVSLRGKIGQFGEKIAAYELARVHLLITAKVKEAYYKTVLSQRAISALDETAELLDEFIASATAKYQSGGGLYLDVLRARVEKTRLQNELIETRKELLLDKARLNLLLGKKGDEPLELRTELSFAPLTKDLAAIQEEAVRTRPSIQIASLRLEQAQAGLKLAQKGKLPDFSVGLYTPSLRTGSWGFSLGVSVPLYWWKKQKGEILEFEAKQEIGTISAEAVERRIMTRIGEAYAAVKSSEEQVKVFETRLLTEVEDQVKMSITQYQYGKTDALNILDITRTYLTVKLEHLKSLYLYLVSLSDLEQAGEEYE
jgi:cobalt-zinc-cadmium efflux system outer membrane protein